MRKPPANLLRSTLKGVVLSLAVLACTGACSRHVDEPGEGDFKPAAAPPEEPGPDKLQIIDDKLGTGREAKSGDTVSVHYTGTLMNGTKFDSSRDRGTPFEFKLGTGGVIKGRLVIPQDLAYGERGQPPTIPPKAALKFDIELIDVK